MTAIYFFMFLFGCARNWRAAVCHPEGWKGLGHFTPEVFMVFGAQLSSLSAQGALRGLPSRLRAV
jgi:hypothetical protein